MAIVVSFDEGTKLLRVLTLDAVLKEKFGTTASSTIKNKLDSWSCTEELYRMVFDTTSSNSRKHNNTCVLL